MRRDLSIGRWICDRARATPDRVAIESDDLTCTYGQLHAGVHAAAAAMCGLAPGERVAVLSSNRPEYVALVFGAALAGLVVVPLSWRQSPAELAYQLGDSHAAWLVADEDNGDLARAALSRTETAPQLLSLGDVVPDDVARDAVAADSCSSTERAVDDGTPLFIFYTSGTTGRPKGAVLSHANVFWANLSFDRMADVASSDVVLQVLPQFHVGGWNCQPLLAMWKGATLALERSFDPGRVLDLIACRGITTMMGVPASYQFIASHERFEETDLSSLRYVLVGGAPMSEALLLRWEDRGVRIVQGYGLTEAAPNVLCLPAEDASRRLGFAGKPYPHVDVGIVDPDSGVPLDGPAIGELVVRGPNVFLGYWDDPEATRQAMRGGWLHTGDVAERDLEGFYRIRDRIKDMYISGGENVYPAEIETVLASHPAIVEAAVIAIPDERWGEAGLAVVVALPGAALGEDDVRAWCADRLGRYKVPREFRFVDALPRSAMDKVQKTELRARFGAGAPG